MQQAIFESDQNEDRINENDEDDGLTSNASSLHNDVCTPAAEHDDQELTNPDDIDIAAACNPTPSVPIPIPNLSAGPQLQIKPLHHCCPHVCRAGSPPPDRSKCCYHRCRPGWTLEQRIKNYGSGN